MEPKRKFLCIDDNTAECRSAIVFAAERARKTKGGIVILRIIEPLDNSLLSSIGAAIIDDIKLEALENLQSLASLAKEKSGIIAQTLILEGELYEKIPALIDEDENIKTLVLAAARGKAGLGSMVNAATRGTISFGKRAVAILIVPANLTDDEIIELAS